MVAKKKETIVKSESEVKEKKKRNIKSNKRRGSDYERQIAKELREFGYDMVTSRSESKAMDDMKIDLIDKSNTFPAYCQIKRTIKYPNFIEIEKSCPLKDKEMILFWNVQRATDSTFRSDGELVIMNKKFFYELLNAYKHYKLITE